LKKRNEKVERMRGEGFGGLIFLHNTKFFSFEGIKKLYWGRVLGGFGGFI
jgi:hypothetical protein